jgi:adenylate cyclase
MARQFSVMGNERHQEIIVRLCKRAVELDPSYAAPWATMAVAQWDMHRRSASDDDGSVAANRAISLDPKLADAHAALGAAHQGQGRFEEGLRACEAALELDPESYEGNRVAGMCCLAMHRFDEGARYFEKAASVMPAEFVAASFAEQCYLSKGDVESARKSARAAMARVEAVIAAEPDHGRALGYGAGLLANLGEKERAMEWIERGTLLDPDNTILHFNFVCALSRMGEIEAAIDLLSSVIFKASKGWLNWLDKDTDLDPLRDQPRFVEVVRQARARFD